MLHVRRTDKMRELAHCSTTSSTLAKLIERTFPREHAGGRTLPLVVNTDDPGLEAIINAASPQMIQCHGTETPERIAAIRTRFGLPVMKAIRVESAETLTLAQEYDDAADRMLFDSAPLDAVLPGGTGHAFDWGIMQQWNGRKPWMLAGGLNAGNVSDAITISGAASVDVSSGVESAPGIKDHAAIRHFVTAAL